MLKYNKIQTVGESDAYGVFVDSNRTGEVTFYERDNPDTSRFIANCFKAIGGFRTTGFRYFDLNSNDNGISYESDYADSNAIILSSVVQTYYFNPPKGIPYTFHTAGHSVVQSHSKNGIYVGGRLNRITGSGVYSVGNLQNVMMLDERATSTQVRNSLGSHTVSIQQNYSYHNYFSNNGDNGIYIVSDSARGLSRTSFGNTSTILADCFVNNNSTTNLGAHHCSGAWVDEAGGSFYATGCSFSGSLQFTGSTSQALFITIILLPVLSASINHTAFYSIHFLTGFR